METDFGEYFSRNLERLRKDPGFRNSRCHYLVYRREDDPESPFGEIIADSREAAFHQMVRSRRFSEGLDYMCSPIKESSYTEREIRTVSRDNMMFMWNRITEPLYGIKAILPRPRDAESVS